MRNSILFHNGCTTYIPAITSVTRVHASHSLANICAICDIFDNSNSDRYEVMLYLIVLGVSLMMSDMSVFWCTCWPFTSLLGKCLFSYSSHFWCCVLLVLSCKELFIYIAYWPLISHVIFKYFLLFVRVTFCFGDGLCCCAKLF